MLEAGALDIRWTEVFEGIESDAFRELAVLAREVARAPIALVTLVDENRHWFTSVTGIEIADGPWEETFCSHAVRQTDVFEVADATLDQRFAQNPLVHNRPYVRFYAGVPLVTTTGVVGTLCVMDDNARALTTTAATGLRALARQVVMQLELRRQTIRLAQLNAILAAEAIERRRSEALLRQSERALRESQRELKQLDAERRELLTNISHDLRTPLTSLQGYLDTLLMKAATLDAAKQREYLEQAAAKSGRVARLVSDLFELTQLESGHVELKSEPFGLAELVRDVVQAFALAAAAKGVRTSLECDARHALVVGDVRLVERVLENLLDNAIRFTPEGGLVRASCAQLGDRIIVRVSDTGPGIAPSDQYRIFDRFYRGRQDRGRSTTTTGLGLAIARRIVELHGGTITVAEGELGGATLTFWLLSAETPA